MEEEDDQSENVEPPALPPRQPKTEGNNTKPAIPHKSKLVGLLRSHLPSTNEIMKQCIYRFLSCFTRQGMGSGYTPTLARDGVRDYGVFRFVFPRTSPLCYLRSSSLIRSLSSAFLSLFEV